MLVGVDIAAILVGAADVTVGSMVSWERQPVARKNRVSAKNKPGIRH